MDVSCADAIASLLAHAMPHKSYSFGVPVNAATILSYTTLLVASRAAEALVCWHATRHYSESFGARSFSSDVAGSGTTVFASTVSFA